MRLHIGKLLLTLLANMPADVFPHMSAALSLMCRLMGTFSHNVLPPKRKLH